jgi:hypothetical protein
MLKKRKMLGGRVRRAALLAASVEIRRAQFNSSPLYVSTLTARLRREYPQCQGTASDLQSEIVKLAAREAVPVVVDPVLVVLATG